MFRRSSRVGMSLSSPQSGHCTWRPAISSSNSNLWPQWQGNLIIYTSDCGLYSLTSTPRPSVLECAATKKDEHASGLFHNCVVNDVRDIAGGGRRETGGPAARV